MGYMASKDGCDRLELVILAGKWIIERMKLSLPIISVFVSLYIRNNGETNWCLRAAIVWFGHN
jgi:hypothetical protein